MLLPVTVRAVYPISVKTIKVGSQKSVDRTRRTTGCAEDTFFQYLWALRDNWPTRRIGRIGLCINPVPVVACQCDALMTRALAVVGHR